MSKSSDKRLSHLHSFYIWLFSVLSFIIKCFMIWWLRVRSRWRSVFIIFYWLLLLIIRQNYPLLSWNIHDRIWLWLELVKFLFSIRINLSGGRTLKVKETVKVLIHERCDIFFNFALSISSSCWAFSFWIFYEPLNRKGETLLIPSSERAMISK